MMRGPARRFVLIAMIGVFNRGPVFGQATADAVPPGYEFSKGPGGRQWIALNQDDRSFMYLEVKDSFVGKMALTAWRADDGKMVLYGDAGTFSFVDDGGSVIYNAVRFDRAKPPAVVVKSAISMLRNKSSSETRSRDATESAKTGPLSAQEKEVPGVKPSLSARRQKINGSVLRLSFEADTPIDLSVILIRDGKILDDPEGMRVFAHSFGNRAIGLVFPPEPGFWVASVSVTDKGKPAITGSGKRVTRFLYECAFDAALISPFEAAVGQLSALAADGVAFDTGMIDWNGDYEKDLPRALDARGRTMLHYAAALSDPRPLEFLLSRNRVVPDSWLNAVDEAGVSPLMLAAEAGREECLDLLLGAGALVPLRDDAGNSARRRAAAAGRSDLVAALDAAFPEEPPAVAPASLAGRWEGESYSGYLVRFYELEIEERDGRLTAEGRFYSGLSAAQRRTLAEGRKLEPPPDGGFEYARVLYRLYLHGTRFIAAARSISEVTCSYGLSGDFDLAGTVTPDGLLLDLDTAPRAGRRYSRFIFAREGDQARRIPFTPSRGKTVKLACAVNPWFHYNVYVPAGYDPGRPAPVIIFDSAGGNAPPLATETADELGWLSVGLVEASNALDDNTLRALCGSVVLFDLRRRFSIDPRRVYLAGFSEGARVSQYRAACYADGVAGVLSMGIGRSAIFSVPIFDVFGDKDPNRGDKQPNTSENEVVRIVPGGHQWNYPAIHAEALRWLDSRKGP